ncbi:cytidine deaminase-like isoform X3 [Anneissia japonica]|uniref:cytidine deaminase-like isoform X3 n=1 Tax=Anneissia japonica TaxID=1529436 RepID=UPI001425A31F|nr:cytidine deaminase-like isoform X3 [Anneissia japonica]
MEAAQNDSNNLTPEVIKKLIESAHEAKKKSHSPYSNFRVGAAILTEEGKTIRGCNVENASYTLGLCAERVAIFKAVSDGYTNFKALAIACDVKDADLAPCGACRQIMHEESKNLEIFEISVSLILIHVFKYCIVIHQNRVWRRI